MPRAAYIPALAKVVIEVHEKLFGLTICYRRVVLGFR